MQALLSHPKHGRLTVCDNAVFDMYISEGWSVLSIVSDRDEDILATFAAAERKQGRTKRKVKNHLKHPIDQ